MLVGTLTIGSSGVAGAPAKAQGYVSLERSRPSLTQVSSKLWNTEPRGRTLFEKAAESSPQGRVLVLDNEGPPRKALRAALCMSGFSVEEARNGWEALSMLREHRFDLVLLAANMLRVSCTEACRRIRGISPQAGIVIITVGDLEDDKIRALDAGADDCVTKRFNLRELTARLRAVLRRTHAQETAELTVLGAGALRMDLERRLVWRGADEIHLSPKAFELLAFMMKHPGTTLMHSKFCVPYGVWNTVMSSNTSGRTCTCFARKSRIIQRSPSTF
jgi:two-component system, OmpR family, KDP operon response regulator KdpE